MLGLFSLCMLLPPLFSLSDSIWLSIVVVPIMTMGLAFAISSRVDISVMSAPSWKNQMIIDRQMVVYGFWCYGMKFIPSIFNVTLMGAFNLRWICNSLSANSTLTSCSWVYPINLKTPTPVGEHNNMMNEHSVVVVHRPQQCISTWSCENFNRLIYVQQFSIFFLVLYFVIISSCFVYRSRHAWRRNPAANKIWASISLFV
jgi:hypothetical protein